MTVPIPIAPVGPEASGQAEPSPFDVAPSHAASAAPSASGAAAAASASAPAGSGKACSTNKECTQGEVCQGAEGCSAQWTCGPAKKCTKDMVSFCGCDGKTFEGSSTCPSQKFSARGACGGGPAKKK